VRRQNQQVAAGAIVEDGRWLGALHDELRARLAPVFAQARSRLAAFAYLGALLTAGGDRRSCWQLAEAAGYGSPRRMQALLAEHRWDWREALSAVQRFIVSHLGSRDAVVVLDETAELKQGRMTVAVARQKNATSKARGRQAWISIRSGSGTPSAGTPSCPCAPSPSWPSQPPARSTPPR
jgi:hypothetical protein